MSGAIKTFTFSTALWSVLEFKLPPRPQSRPSLSRRLAPRRPMKPLTRARGARYLPSCRSTGLTVCTRSTWSHVAPRTSPIRAAVRTMNSSAGRRHCPSRKAMRKGRDVFERQGGTMLFATSGRRRRVDERRGRARGADSRRRASRVPLRHREWSRSDRAIFAPSLCLACQIGVRRQVDFIKSSRSTAWHAERGLFAGRSGSRCGA